jgi:hypothetical protein
VAVIFSLLTTVFAMSGDGNNEPAKQTQEVKQDAQVENAEQLDQTKSNSTAKDWFGFDTGMTEKEFQEHQEVYIQRWIEFHEAPQAKHGKRVFKNETKENEFLERIRNKALISYQQRLNLNAIPKFEKFGIGSGDYFAGYDAHGVEPYTYATTISQVVIHGVVTIGYDSLKHAGYYLKPIEIVKGGFYYEKLPDIIPFNVWGELNDGQEYIVFLGVNSNTKDINKLNKIRLENIGLPLNIRDKTKVYSGLYYIGEISEIKSKIREIDHVNDTQNFYNRSYK